MSDSSTQLFGLVMYVTEQVYMYDSAMVHAKMQKQLLEEIRQAKRVPNSEFKVEILEFDQSTFMLKVGMSVETEPEPFESALTHAGINALLKEIYEPLITQQLQSIKAAADSLQPEAEPEPLTYLELKEQAYRQGKLDPPNGGLL